MKFEIIKEDKKTHARAGILHTNHGPINTPVFMPVGTQGTVKALTWDMLTQIGAQVILGNTYHLSLRPGIELIRQWSGLHEFIGWNGPILTDSGGYQVFSLANMRKITQDGVTFKSHLDGSKHIFTPESVIDLQLGFNSDILMPLDICTEYPSTYEKTKADLDLTLKWEQRAKTHWEKNHKGNILFGLIQGGFYPDLRAQSIKTLTHIDFPGYAIGGISVGEPIDLMNKTITETAAQLPKDKPRYLMGVGLPENFDHAINQGIDMFDCVTPTRLARHGHAFTQNGRINLINQKYKTDPSPIDPTCDCPICRQFSKAYIKHLISAKEIAGMIYLSYHNVHYLIRYIENIRKGILEDQ